MKRIIIKVALRWVGLYALFFALYMLVYPLAPSTLSDKELFKAALSVGVLAIAWTLLQSEKVK